jgi:hypothetical protein
VSKNTTAEFVRTEPRPLRWNLAAAAGIVLSLFTLYYVWTYFVPHAVKPVMVAVTTDEQRNGASLRLALVRGSEAAPVLQSGTTRVEIVGLFDQGFHYSVVLERLEKDKPAHTVASLYSQHPTSPVTIEVAIDGDRTYLIRVRKQASSDESLDFAFTRP